MIMKDKKLCLEISWFNWLPMVSRYCLHQPDEDRSKKAESTIFLSSSHLESHSTLHPFTTLIHSVFDVLFCRRARAWWSNILSFYLFPFSDKELNQSCHGLFCTIFPSLIPSISKLWYLLVAFSQRSNLDLCTCFLF